MVLGLYRPLDLVDSLEDTLGSDFFPDLTRPEKEEMLAAGNPQSDCRELPYTSQREDNFICNLTASQITTIQPQTVWF